MHAAVGPDGRDTAREYGREVASIGGPSRQGQRPPGASSGPLRPLVAGLQLLLVAVGLALATAATARPDRITNASVPTTLSGAGVRDCRVYLPPSYATDEGVKRRYPVIVFLHGWPGAEGNWPGQGHAGETLDRLIATQRIPEVIGLFPDGTGVGHLGRSMWLDSRDGRSRLETFLAHDLVAWADRTFRTLADPAYRGVIGLSDGATGAMNQVLRHPDVYGAVGAHSGVYRLTSDWSSGPLFGDEPQASRMREAYSPFAELLEHHRRLTHATIYFDCGEQDESIADNHALHARLDSLHITHEFHVYPGSHDWDYWRAHLEQSLIAVTARMGPEAGAAGTLSHP